MFAQLKLYGTFWWRCAREAWRNSWGLANGLGSVLGGAALSALALRLHLTANAPTSVQGAILFTSIIALLSVLVIWVFIYFVRLLGAPAQLYAQLKAKFPTPPTTDIRLELLDHVAYEGGVVDAQGIELPPAMAFIVRATNTGNKFLQKCQLTFGEKERYNYPASGYFDLRPGEYRDIPVLRVNARGSDPRAFVYFLRNEDWKIECNGPSWLTGPAVYEIKALSADTHPSTLNVRLIFDSWKY